MPKRSLKGPVCDNPSVGSFASLNGGGHDSRASASKPLKGRRRFTADLSELNAHPELIARSVEWSVKSVKPGDEESSLEVVLANANQSKAQTIILVVSDSSHYPNKHSYFGYSQDAGALELDVARVMDKLPTQAGRTLQEAVGFFVEAISLGGDDEGHDSNDDEDEEDSDFMMLDDDLEQSSYLAPQSPQLSLGHLMKDFVEVKAAGYNPGILWTGINTFILSISLPVLNLFQHIPPHALLTWDQHFLEPGFHLTLLITGFRDVYPALQQDGSLTPHLLRTGSTLKFKVGFTQQYKPSSNNATTAFREITLPRTDKNREEDTDNTTSDSDMLDLTNDPDPGVFLRMSLSASLESLLDQQLLRLLQLRRKFSLGWAGAEELLWQIETTQQDPAIVFQQKKKELESAELAEKKLSQSNNLPYNSADTNRSEINILETSFVFLLRRLALSTRHCVVCHKKLGGKHEALRPYVCTSELCVFQYYSLNLGPSVEHEIITNTGAVDLLVSLAYVSAAEGVLNEPLPRGMGLRVQRPINATVDVDENNLCEFDSLGLHDMRTAVKELLASLPPIKDMKEYLQRQFAAGNTKARLRDINPDILPAAWSVLRWCVASCTAHIQELTKPEDRLGNLGEYRQFRFLVGAPDKEKKFRSALPQGDHPTLFAFHGSPLRNWHSIIRHGLWFKDVSHGRSHGNGVYFCQDASVSLSSYAQPSSTVWRNSMIRPQSCCTLAEIVNRRQNFVFNGPPYFVVDKTEWIMCRYLLVRTHAEAKSKETELPLDQQPPEEPEAGKYLKQEKNFSTRLGGIPVDIPQPSYQLDKLVRACVSARKEIILEAEDRAIFDGPKEEPSGSGVGASSSRDTNATVDTRVVPSRIVCVWKPDDEWIQRNAQELLPPPTQSSLTASVALQREYRSMMREQNTALEKDDLTTLGWYLPPQHNEGNLYQWLVELHSFDPELPVAKDMKSKDVASVAMEIRFPPSFPYAPPFFRVIRPRFRPFVQGGGGHVTLGGSICMDLLTSDGWVPSYSVSAVLLQIKLAMSSTTPYPARLQHDWDRAYTPEEALGGYIRAASVHNWKIKNEEEIRRLVTAR